VIESRVTRSFRTLLTDCLKKFKRERAELTSCSKTIPNIPAFDSKKLIRWRMFIRFALGWDRVLGVLEGSTIVWFWIGSHAKLRSPDLNRAAP